MKSKGFTLIELLAVIVILAVLVLAATPAVASIMTNSIKNTFASEAKVLMKAYDMAYMDINAKPSVSYMDTRKLTDDWQKVFDDSNNVDYDSYHSVKRMVKTTATIGGKKRNVKVLCLTLKDLVDDGYIQKNISNYHGHIVTFTLEGGKVFYYIMLTDGNNRYDYFAMNEVYYEGIRPLNPELRLNAINSCLGLDQAYNFDMDMTISYYHVSIPKF